MQNFSFMYHIKLLTQVCLQKLINGCKELVSKFFFVCFFFLKKIGLDFL